MTPLRVLTVSKGLGPGGTERLLVSVAAARDPEVVEYEAAYVLPYKDHLVPRLEGLGVRTHLLGTRRGLADPRWVLRLRHLVATRGFDVVHFHSPAVAALGAPAVRTLRSAPVIVSTEHNVWGSLAPPTRWARAMTIGADDAVVTVSDEVRGSMGRAGRGAQVVVHGIPVAELAGRRDERAAARAHLGLSANEPVVVTVANLRETKDYPNLLAAAELVAHEVPDVTFLAVGQGPLLERMRDRAAGLGDRFRFLGHQEDVVPVLAAADVFTLASRHEGLPIALLEAMAVGLPSVVTDVGASATVVRTGSEGLVVRPRDPAALAGAITELLRDPGRRAAMGEAATRRAEDFEIGVAARRLERLYREVVTRRVRR